MLVFAGYHAYRHFFSDYTTENVYRYTVYHSTTAQGVFFREEKSLDQSAGSNLRYAVRDGEKVRVGSVLAYRYSDALSADLAERRAEAQKELTSLKNRIRGLGSVNVGAIEEYKEVSERYQFLKAQRKRWHWSITAGWIHWR